MEQAGVKLVYFTTRTRNEEIYRTEWFFQEILVRVFGCAEVNYHFQRAEMVIYARVLDEAVLFRRKLPSLGAKHIWEQGTSWARDLIMAHIHRSRNYRWSLPILGEYTNLVSPMPRSSSAAVAKTTAVARRDLQHLRPRHVSRNYTPMISAGVEELHCYIMDMGRWA